MQHKCERRRVFRQNVTTILPQFSVRSCAFLRPPKRLLSLKPSFLPFFLILTLVWHAKGGVTIRGCCIKTVFAHFCTIMQRNLTLFCRPFWEEKKHRNAQKGAQKRTKMHKNAPFCTDACNTPVYKTPVSVHSS